MDADRPETPSNSLFHFCTRCHILATQVTIVEDLHRRKAQKGVYQMDQNQNVETEAQLVTESLVEEVSIDGMCGVY